jgi:hypothetical protein
VEEIMEKINIAHVQNIIHSNFLEVNNKEQRLQELW